MDEPHPAAAASNGRVIRTLKDGYWDRTEVIELPNGEQRVRKQTKGAASGPWGVSSLRREIRYLTTLPDRARAVFPPVRAAWDNESTGVPDVGYEMPFYENHSDTGLLARHEALTQGEIDDFQDALAEAVLERLHEPAALEQSLAAHVTSVVGEAWATLEKDAGLAALINAPIINLNGTLLHGPRAAFERIRYETDVLTLLDAGPAVRLHGDLFLENILWQPAATLTDRRRPRLILIDPVSVAGIMCGPPVFDLVKYVSYATGHLPALRSEKVDVACADTSGGGASIPNCCYRVRWEDPAVRPFCERDWHTRFQRAFTAHHGSVNLRLYHLIDGYFHAAMTVNTTGLQRLARLLRATAAFNAVPVRG